MTDTQKVLKLFRENPNMELNHRIIVVDMGISEYSGRITNAREELGCTCGKDKDSCTASEHIINTRKGFYKFVTQTDKFVTHGEVVKTREEQIVMSLSYGELLQKRSEIIKKWGDPESLDPLSLARFKADLRGNGCDRESLKEAKHKELIKTTLF